MTVKIKDCKLVQYYIRHMHTPPLFFECYKEFLNDHVSPAMCYQAMKIFSLCSECESNKRSVGND